MYMAVLVGLADGAKGLAEIPPIVVLAGLVHVGEDDENLLVGIAGEGVGSQFRDVEAKLLHVLLEGLLPIEGVLQDGLLDLEHLAFGGPLGGGRDCIEELRETVFVNPLWGAVCVLRDVVRDGGLDNGSNGFGGAFLGADGCLDRIIAIVGFNLGLYLVSNCGFSSMPVFFLSLAAAFLALKRTDLVVIRSVDLIKVRALTPTSASLRMPSPGCASL